MMEAKQGENDSMSRPDAWNSHDRTTDDCISRQAAINAICEDGTRLERNGHYSMTMVERKQRDVDILENLPPAQPEWIPVTDRLPEEEKKTYWVCTDGGYQHECRWTNANPIWTHLTTDWHWNIFDIPQYSRVIAWMPLPEPYKGGEYETD